MTTKNEILSQLKSINGRRRERILTESDVEMIFDEIEQADPKVNRIRVYPSNGFVPNAYNKPYGVDAYCLDAIKTDQGWSVDYRSYHCNRPNGSGPKLTRNNR